jgi:hypothetical protein
LDFLPLYWFFNKLEFEMHITLRREGKVKTWTRGS